MKSTRNQNAAEKTRYIRVVLGLVSKNVFFLNRTLSLELIFFTVLIYQTKNHSFGTYAKFPEKLIFHTPWYAKNVSLSEKFA